MSSANLDLVRSIFAARERGDLSDAGWADPEIEYVIVDGPDPGSFKGLAGLVQAMRQALRPWEHLHTQVDQYRELDGERVLVLHRFSGRGKASGLELDAPSSQGAQVLHIRHGKVTKIVFYYDRDRALADLGLAREGDAAESP